MEIVLTFRGKIEAGRNQENVWRMRDSFNSQLRKLWGKYPFEILETWKSVNSHLIGNASWNGGNFYSIYGQEIGIGARIDIQILLGNHELSSVMRNGDLDNRYKRIVDALCFPLRADENQKFRIFASTDPDYVCLLSDDSAILEIKASCGVFLDSGGPEDSLAILRINPSPLRLSVDTLEMAI